MFLFKASAYLEVLEQFQPDILNACEQALAEGKEDLDLVRADKRAFTTCQDDSIDCAVMEKNSDAVVVPLNAGWSDTGS
jgi:mannose-1-phosphate guanylyltransferase